MHYQYIRPGIYFLNIHSFEQIIMINLDDKYVIFGSLISIGRYKQASE
jgi:hypothetical protein